MQSRAGCSFVSPHSFIHQWLHEPFPSRCTNKFAIETLQMSMDYLAAQVSEAVADGTTVIFWRMENRNLTPLKDNWFSVFYFPGIFLQERGDYRLRLFFGIFIKSFFFAASIIFYTVKLKGTNTKNEPNPVSNILLPVSKALSACET